MSYACHEYDEYSLVNATQFSFDNYIATDYASYRTILLSTEVFMTSWGSDIMNAPNSEDELSYVLLKAKKAKAGDTDAKKTAFYKNSTQHLNRTILALFNYVFENRNCPEIWSHGIISPIYKAGELRCP